LAIGSEEGAKELMLCAPTFVAGRGMSDIHALLTEELDEFFGDEIVDGAPVPEETPVCTKRELPADQSDCASSPKRSRPSQVIIARRCTRPWLRWLASFFGF
jgi:hypothetical protein